MSTVSPSIPSSRRPRAHRPDGEATRERIHSAALALFRKKGYDATSMRDVARSARVSLGLAYHYFPSKHGLVLAFYEARQREHSETARALVRRTPTVRDRIAGIIHTKIDLMRADRALIAALTRVLLDPADPLSAFSAATHDIRAEAVGIFREALDDESIAEPVRDSIATSIWAAHMGILLYWLHDESPDQRLTRGLVDALADLVLPLAVLASQPMFGPLGAQLLASLEAAGLVVHPQPQQPPA